MSKGKIPDFVAPNMVSEYLIAQLEKRGEAIEQLRVAIKEHTEITRKRLDKLEDLVEDHIQEHSMGVWSWFYKHRYKILVAVFFFGVVAATFFGVRINQLISIYSNAMAIKQGKPISTGGGS